MRRDEELDKDMSKIVKRISKIRMQKGYSHEAMALSLGFSRVSYSNIESGKTKLGLRRLYQIAHILKVCPSVFLKDEMGGGRSG